MDIYDREVARLTEFPERIHRAWAEVTPLFGFVGTDPLSGCSGMDKPVGCLTMIRAGYDRAHTPYMTRLIRADKRIPTRPDLIKPRHLPVFAEWQRRIDKARKRWIKDAR